MSALVSNQKTFAGCYAFGKAAEGTALAKLQNSPVWAGLEINRSVGDKDTYDYITPCGLRFEMKTRRNTKRAFPTTIMPMAKGVANGEGSIFLFNFTDGLYYIVFNKAFFDENCYTDEIEAADRPDANPEMPKWHWLIPHWLLRRVSDGEMDEWPPSIKQRWQITTY
jgi:hypothetical protein